MSSAALNRVSLRALYPDRFAAVRLVDRTTRESKTLWIDEHVQREGLGGDDDDESDDSESADEGVVLAAARPKVAEREPSAESRQLRSVAVGGAEGASRVMARRSELRRMIGNVNARILHSRYAE